MPLTSRGRSGGCVVVCCRCTYSGRQCTTFVMYGHIDRGHTQGRSTQEFFFLLSQCSTFLLRFSTFSLLPQHRSFFFLLFQCSIFLLRFSTFSPSRRGFSSPFSDSTVKLNFVYSRHDRSPRLGVVVQRIPDRVAVPRFEPTTDTFWDIFPPEVPGSGK